MAWSQRIVDEWNDTDVVWPQTDYLRLLAGHARTAPDVQAVVQGGRTITYAELHRCTNRIAHRLRDLGVGEGSRVGLLCPRGADYVLGALGILKAGAAVVPLDPVNPDRRICAMVADAEPQALLTTAALAERAPSGPLALDLADAIAWDPRFPGRDGAPSVVVDDDTVSHLIYTSGSTGQPKAVLERLGAVRNLVHWTGRAYGVTAGDRASWLSTPGFAVQIMEWMPYLGLGVTVCIPEAWQAQTPAQTRDWLVAERVTHAMLVAALAERAWALPWPDDTALRIMVTTAERVHSWPPVDTPFRVVMTYGTTETTHALSCLDIGAGIDLTSPATPPDVRATHPVPVGRPIANVRAYLLDDDDRPVPPGIVGHLFIGGAGVAHGYHRRAELTAERFRPSPLPGPAIRLYHTGDLGRYRTDGTIELLGRVDAQVKIRGFRVELGEVETAVAALPSVREAAVVAAETTPGDVSLVAYVAGEAELDVAGLRSTLADRLPYYMVPRAIVALLALPRLPNGKIALRALPNPEEAVRAVGGAEYAAPTNELEVSLVRTWRRLFGGRTVGVEDNFFDLGGHSLLAFQLLDAVRQEFAVELSMTDLYRHPTIARLAEVLTHGAEGGGRFAELDPVVPDPAHRYEPFPLTDSQQALWIGRGGLVELGNVGCHGYFEWESLDLDLDRFERAWNRVVDRHDALRTVIRPDGTQQVLADVGPYLVPTVDLRQEDAGTIERTLLAIRSEMSHQVIGDAWPLFDLRAALLPPDADRSRPVRVQLALDFLIADAWSYFQVLVPDLVRCYENPDAELPALELTFRDYVLGVARSLHDSDLYRRSSWYWTDRLDTLPGAPQLPRRPADQAGLPVRFDRCSTRMAAAPWARLCEQASQAGVTPSAALAAAYAEVLAEWCSDRRFCLNFPLFNRLPLHAQTGQIVGDMTTTMLLEVDGAGETFADRAQALQRRMWTDLEHRYFSGMEVLRALTRRRGTLAPAMPVIMTSLVGHPPAREDTAIGVPVYAISQTPQVSLDCQVFDHDGGIRFNWDFLPSLFPDGCVEAMFDAFRALLERLTDPDGWLTEVFGFGPQAGLRPAPTRLGCTRSDGVRAGEAWERYWCSVDATGRGGDVLWDVDSEEEMAWLMEQVSEHFDPSLPIVDLGCGNGRYSRALARSFGRVVGVDVSAAAVERARRESIDIPGLRFEVLDAAREGAVEELAAAVSPANVLVRGVLHVLDDSARAAVADTVERLLGASGAALVLEPMYEESSFGYVGFVGGARGRAAELVRPLEAAGVRHSTRFGADELLRFFPREGWTHLEVAGVAMHALDPESDQRTLRLPGFFAALRRRDQDDARVTG